MTADPNGWPERPGVPENPEVDGWYWLQNRKPNRAPYPVRWKAGEGWVWNTVAYFPTADTAARYRYLGPCLLPAEAAWLREALERILALDVPVNIVDTMTRTERQAVEIARAALAKEQTDGK